MASFSDRFRYSYHVAPLHALKPIWKRKALISKAALAGEIGMRRNTTACVDQMLGFGDFVHFYLPHGVTINFAQLPILLAQMGPSPVPAFPHCVLVVDTSELTDDDCVVCNYNIAVSRPAYPGVQGGNHTRGTNPDIILKHWRGFRESTPSTKAMRRSYWHDGLEVPVLTSKQITDCPSSVGFGVKNKVPELLLRTRYCIRAIDRLFVFSAADRATVQKLPDPPSLEVAECKALTWYASGERVAAAVRAAVNSYFSNEPEPFPSHLDFDRVRPKPKDESNPGEEQL